MSARPLTKARASAEPVILDEVISASVASVAPPIWEPGLVSGCPSRGHRADRVADQSASPRSPALTGDGSTAGSRVRPDKFGVRTQTRVP